jgi:hypothetical protein
MEMFRLGGFGMIPTFVFGLLTVAAAIRFAVRPDRNSGPIQITLGVATLASGGLGFTTGLIKSFAAMNNAKPGESAVWLIGTSESLYNLALAFGMVTIAAMFASAGALRVGATRA